MKNIVLPVVCLLVGGAAGYGLRSMSGGDDESAAETTASGASSTSKAAKDRLTAGIAASSAMTGSTDSLSDRMKELLVDFDIKSAQKVAAKLSVEELQSALALLASMPKSMERDSLRAQLYRAWAAKEPHAAWKAALADPLDSKGSLTGAVASAVAKTNPTAAIDLVLSLGMGGRRSIALGLVFNEWGKNDIAAAIAYASAHPELPMDSMSVSFSLGLGKLAEKEPIKAANLALGLKDEFRRGSALTSLMTTWVERDPAAAFNWALALQNPKLRQDAIASAVGAWAKTDPKAALAYVESIPDAQMRDSSFKKAWTDWFKNDPLNATDYLSTAKNDKLKENVRFEFAYFSESLSPKERGELLSRIPAGDFKNDVLRSMTDSHIRKGNYNQAMELLNDMPDSTGRDRNVFKLGEEWTKNDPAAVSEWLKKLPDSSDRDLAIAGYTGTLSRSDPTAAIEWANTIPDVKVREGALRNIAMNWFKADPAKAQAWMAGIPSISASDKKMIESLSKLNTDIVSMPISVGQRR